MDKAEYGSEYTNRKRGQRGGFRDPELRRMVRDGKISPSALIPNSDRNTSNTGVQTNNVYRRLYYAQVETLLFYFDEEWFDFDGLIRETLDKRSTNMTGVSKAPMRCNACEKPWCTAERGEYYYLSKSNFKNIPLEKKVCPKCEDALPVAVG